MLSSRQLQCFVAVAEELHFARAADRLQVAQSAVSIQVQQLEQHLDVRLLHRYKRRPITLTDAGALFYAEAQAALRHLDRAEQIGILAARGLSGTVRLGYVTSAVTAGLVSRMLKAFRRTHPDVKLEMVLMETPKQLAGISDAEIDVGLVRPRRKYPEGVQAVTVHREQLIVAMAEDHPLARRKEVKSADLSDETFITPQFDEVEGFSEPLARLARLAGSPRTAEYRVNDFITAASLAAAGYGIALVPQSLKMLRLPGVTFQAIADFRELASLAMAFRRREPSPAVKSFVSSARQLLTP
jgi:DNA-binding transcriptional LysR family regulator